MEGAEAWVTQPLHYNRSCALLAQANAVSPTQQGHEAALQSQRAESFLSSSKGRKARQRRKQQEQERLRQQGGGALVELERSTVQSFCK
mgnify:CR=1 FL=1